MEEVCDRLGPAARRDYWFTSKSVLQRGVFFSRAQFNLPRVSTQKRREFITKHIAPVADKKGQKSLLFHVTYDGGASYPNPRAGIVVAGCAQLCDFLAYMHNEGVSRLPSFKSTGFYWEMWHPSPNLHLWVHPYVDIDMGGVPASASFHDVFVNVHRTICVINEKFKSLCDTDNFEVAIFYNSRLCKGVWKASFHLHWPGLVIPDPPSLSYIFSELSSSLPFKPTFGSLPEGTPMIDTKVYTSKNQCFRLPYCGKQGDSTAALLPIMCDERSGEWTFTVQEGDESSWIFKSCTHTPFNECYVELKIERVHRHLPFSRPSSSSSNISTIDLDKNTEKKWFTFWKPVLSRFVLPNFVQHRQKLMEDNQVTCLSPDTDNVTITSIKKLTVFPASFRIEVVGDTFCEYDHGSTPFTHKGASNSISYVVDLMKGTICQQCVKCRPSTLNWVHFITYQALDFTIYDKEEAAKCAHDVVMVGKETDNIVPFFLRFFFDEVLFCHEKKQVMVYDPRSGIWVTGSDGNRLLLRLVSCLNDAYLTYRKEWNSVKTDQLWAQWQRDNPEADEEKKKKAKEELLDTCKKMTAKISPFWKLTMAQRPNVITYLKACDHPHTRQEMEPFPHLVPLENKKCLDIYTFTLLNIESKYFFTSHLNASIIDKTDPLIKEFLDWQKQVCCGDMNFLLYKRRIFGLSMPLLNFDRRVYIPLGPNGKNGKSSESYLLSLITMGVSPYRGCTIAKEYLTKTAQDKRSANAPDTVLMEMAGKTVGIVDECREGQLDGPLIKSLTSGDTASGRNLYESELTHVRICFSLWIIANKNLRIDYGDTALMNRVALMPYDAQWVADPESVKQKMGHSLPHSLWIFKEDPLFKINVLSKLKDAMTTSCLLALHEYFASVPNRDPEDPTRPAYFQNFPIPQRVRAYTEKIIEREHPLLGFIKKHLKGGATDPETFVEVGVAYQQLLVYGQNKNEARIKFMKLTDFEDGLKKQDISIEYYEDDTEPRLKGYTLSSFVVPIHKRVEGESFFPDGPPPKRLAITSSSSSSW